MSLHLFSLNSQTSVTPLALYPQLSAQIEHLLLEVLQFAHDGQMRVVPSGGLTKASMLQLARRRDPKERLQGVTREEQWPALHCVRILAVGAGLLRVGSDAVLRPTREALAWLQFDPAVRTQHLFSGWLTSDWDELTHLEGMRILPRPSHAIQRAKQTIRQILAQVPDDTWVGIEPFIAQVQVVSPGFFRQDGLSTDWSICDKHNLPIDGDQHWEAIEGVWLRLVVSSTLHWLGMVDIGTNDRQRPIAFRLTELGSAILKGTDLPAADPTDALILQPNYEVLVPVGASPYARFQLWRIADEINNQTIPTYRLTRKSLHAAQARGIGVDEIVAFLETQTRRALPQNVRTTLHEWAGQYGRVTMRRVVLLEADTHATLEQIRHDKRLRLPEIVPMNERVVSIPEDDARIVAERIQKAGYGLASNLAEGREALSDRDLAALMVAVEVYQEVCQVLDIDGEVSSSLRRRLQKQIPEKAITRIRQATQQAMSVLRRRLRDA